MAKKGKGPYCHCKQLKCPYQRRKEKLSIQKGRCNLLQQLKKNTEEETDFCHDLNLYSKTSCLKMERGLHVPSS